MTTPSVAAAHSRAHSLLDDGNRLEAEGRLDDAHARYLDALGLAPDLPRCHLNVGNILRLLGDVKGAIAAYSAALARDPTFAPANFNLGNLYLAGEQIHLAIAQYQRALELRPGFVDAELGLGGAHFVLQQWDEAAAAYARVLRQRPDDPNARVGAYYVSLHLCDWSRRAQDEALLVDMIDHKDPRAAHNPMTLLNLDLPDRPAAQLQRAAGELFASSRLGTWQFSAPGTSCPPSGAPQRLRIGYLSADVCEHPVMHLVKGVLAGHDRLRNEIYLYSYGTTRDALTAQIRNSVDVFRDLSDCSDERAADAIAKDHIDILVDLQGYTGNVRIGITARRPAPVLVNWLGYPATLGHPLLADYIIGDPVVTPIAAAADFSETLALLPHCYLPNDQGRCVGPTPSREVAGLPPEGFVFCNFNQAMKYSPSTFDWWCRLLREVPGSVLWLKETGARAKENIAREALARGVNPNRLVYAVRVSSNADHLGRLCLADLALDTFPYTSHSTACDALWAGVPLVTVRGGTFASRVAASVLDAADLGELVAADAEACFALAVELARNASRREQLRSKLLATRLSVPLFDTARFTRNLEDLFARIWQQTRDGRRAAILPRDIAVPSD